MRSTYPYKTVGEIVSANKRAGRHFFSESTMEYFGCQIHNEVFDGCYFITSEQDSYVSSTGQNGAWEGNRLYTIRIAMPDGSIDTVGEFGEYETLDDAITAVKKL